MPDYRTIDMTGWGKRDSSERLERWLDERRNYIGGSDAAAILGLSNWRSAYATALDKLGILPHTESNEAMDLGNEFEETIRQGAYRRLVERGSNEFLVDTKDTMYVSTIHPFAAVNLDGLLVSNEYGSPVYTGLECKFTDPRGDHGKAILGAEVSDRWFIDIDAVPMDWYAQCQHGMMVRPDLIGFWLAVATGTSGFRLAFIPRDGEFIEKMAEQEAAFWDGVKRGEAPVPSGLESDRAILLDLHPDPEGEVMLGGEAEEWAADYRFLGGQIKEFEDERRGLGNKLLLAMGNAKRATAGRYPINRIQKDYDVKPHHVHSDYVTVGEAKS